MARRKRPTPEEPFEGFQLNEPGIVLPWNFVYLIGREPRPIPQLLMRLISVCQEAYRDNPTCSPKWVTPWFVPPLRAWAEEGLGSLDELQEGLDMAVQKGYLIRGDHPDPSKRYEYAVDWRRLEAACDRIASEDGDRFTRK